MPAVLGAWNDLPPGRTMVLRVFARPLAFQQAEKHDSYPYTLFLGFYAPRVTLGRTPCRQARSAYLLTPDVGLQNPIGPRCAWSTPASCCAGRVKGPRKAPGSAAAPTV